MNAPGGLHAIEVKPNLRSDENKTPVTLLQLKTEVVKPLFTLQRDADLYWSLNGRQLLVIDEYLSGTSKVLFFPVEEVIDGKLTKPPDEMNTLVKEAVIKRLGRTRQIVFYIPAVADWSNNIIMFSVGGETSIKGRTELRTYCFGIEVDTSDMKVLSSFSSQRLRATTGQECRVSP